MPANCSSSNLYSVSAVSSAASRGFIIDELCKRAFVFEMGFRTICGQDCTRVIVTQRERCDSLSLSLSFACFKTAQKESTIHASKGTSRPRSLLRSACVCIDQVDKCSMQLPACSAQMSSEEREGRAVSPFVRSLTSEQHRLTTIFGC